MTKLKIEFDHTWHHHPLTVIGQLNNEQLFVDETGEKHSVEYDVDLADGDHEFNLTIKNKTNNNVLQEQGETVKDSYISIQRIIVDNIDLQRIMLLNAKFYPDHPDPKAPVLEKLTELGYNGQYKFQFTTPLYLWVLEKLNE